MAGLMHESEVEAGVVSLCKALGLLRYHTYRSTRSPAGYPDETVCGPNGVIYRELKSQTGRVSVEQQKWLDDGGECACPGCHVKHLELLTIDHIDGGGAEHRRSLGKSTRDFYLWLKRNEYPAGFQVLCGSCNLAKGTKAACPVAGEEH